jgi:hypothetical protein
MELAIFPLKDFSLPNLLPGSEAAPMNARIKYVGGVALTLVFSGAKYAPSPLEENFAYDLG